MNEGRRAGAGAAAAARQRVGSLFTTGGLGFRDLAIAHVTSTFGDTLVTVALAGTLFFSVPSTEARGNVALYLLLTVAPFAVIGPLLGRMLDRRPSATRLALIGSALLRVVAAVWAVWLIDGLALFPVAFALLVLSRVHGIARNALLPVALDEPTQLVTANARLATIGVLGGVAAAPVGGLLVFLLDGRAALVLAAAAYVVAALSGRLLPRLEDPPTRMVASLRPVLPRHVRLAQIATAVVRLLNGFLLLLLAFAFKDLDSGVLDFGAVLGAGGAGFALAALTSPPLERRLREEPMVVAGLAVEAAAAFVAGQWFGLPAAAALAAAAGFAWGTAKLAFDGLLQRHAPAEGRGAAFTRSETLFQLAWVAGAVVPTALPVPTSVGLVAAGLAALAAQVVYVGNLLLPLRQGSSEDGADPGP
jgi:hypothetical protein